MFTVVELLLVVAVAAICCIEAGRVPVCMVVTAVVGATITARLLGLIARGAARARDRAKECRHSNEGKAGEMWCTPAFLRRAREYLKRQYREYAGEPKCWKQAHRNARDQKTRATFEPRQ